MGNVWELLEDDTLLTVWALRRTTISTVWFFFHRETENQLNTKDDGNTAEPSSTRYNIEFTFDSDVKCAITIYYFATEEIVNKQAVYVYHNEH